MAYIPVVGDIAEIQMKGTLAAAGGKVVNVASVFHYRLALIVAPPTKAALDTAFQTDLAGVVINYGAAANIRYLQSENNIRYVNEATDLATVFAHAQAGVIATDALPSDVAVSMLLRTAKRGREYRGAKRFAGASEIDTTGDVLTGAGLARWQALQAAVFLTIVDALGNRWVPSVLSRKLSQLQTNPTTVVANDVTQVLLNKNVGTMRRRRIATVR